MRILIAGTLLTISILGCTLTNNIFFGMPPEPTPEPPTGTQFDTPSESILITVHGTYDLDRGSYCWNGSGTDICADALVPAYSDEDFIPLPTDVVMEILITPPFATGGFITLRQVSNGEMAAEFVRFALSLDRFGSFTWQPNLPPGDYIMEVFATWEGDIQGDVSYTLPIRLSE